ncbi:hypothetical protein [Oceanirhabdus sp. W0125-5]|uniref:hypothetical protein n=1 Tax=Oceanirhabdus sp. W0125-5 TaxID=2999116 RepID=UPI0022F3288B|nr:hypothetical protein [Oceanirhabdus sp. W0125-5]WBW96736.1 hypothetical protein OW730_24045 [Oceanirhabdus sp. W0125-5]
MKYKLVYDILTFFIGLMASGHLIYIGIRQIRRSPFIMRGFSLKVRTALLGTVIFSMDAIKFEFQMLFSIIALCFIFLFIKFLHIDNKKYYLLNIFNIEKEVLQALLDEHFEESEYELEIESASIFDSLYNEVRINKLNSIKNFKILKRDIEKQISNFKYKGFRIMGFTNILFGVLIFIFMIHIFIKFHM